MFGSTITNFSMWVDCGRKKICAKGLQQLDVTQTQAFIKLNMLLVISNTENTCSIKMGSC